MLKEILVSSFSLSMFPELPTGVCGQEGEEKKKNIKDRDSGAYFYKTSSFLLPEHL